jgi:L,D-transpeptidase catalytic domain
MPFRIFCTILSLIAFASIHTSATPAIMAAGEYDVPSEEEILRAEREIQRLFPKRAEPMLSPMDRARILEQYNHLDPKGWVPRDLLERALIYFEANKAGFTNQQYISIIDFRPRSNHHRFFVIHLGTGEVERFRTTHGLNSDKNKNGWAEAFGNRVNSGMSSVGFVRVAEVYSGKYGRSVRLDGLSETNSNIRRRAVVVHGWDKVKEADQIQGLSWGCMTLDWSLKDAVIDKLRDGSLMLADMSKGERF